MLQTYWDITSSIGILVHEWIGEGSAADSLDPVFVLVLFIAEQLDVYKSAFSIFLVPSWLFSVFVICPPRLRDEIHDCRAVVYITALCKN